MNSIIIRRLSTIKYVNNPACYDCVHFKKWSIFSGRVSADLGKCNKFGTKDVVSGFIYNDNATQCRDDDKKCGKGGEHFALKERFW